MVSGLLLSIARATPAVKFTGRISPALGVKFWAPENTVSSPPFVVVPVMPFAPTLTTLIWVDGGVCRSRASARAVASGRSIWAARISSRAEGIS